MRRMTRVRAIETRRSIVRNATGGLSGVIDGNGQIVASPEVADFREPTYLGAIPLDERCSLFVLFGQWLPGVCCLVVAMVVARACYRALRAASSV
jgi:apolipoprotein N-acyltransferase